MHEIRTLAVDARRRGLMTAYGCGKEEPKKAAEAPARPRAAPPEVVVVKIGHVGPTTGRRPIWARTTKTAPAWRSTMPTPRAS